MVKTAEALSRRQKAITAGLALAIGTNGVAAASEVINPSTTKRPATTSETPNQLMIKDPKIISLMQLGRLDLLPETSRDLQREPLKKPRPIEWPALALANRTNQLTISYPAPTQEQLRELGHCESTDQPDTNTGNGYYGEYQFDMTTWLDNGGGRFASRPDLASELEQQAMVINVERNRGWGPWPNCSVMLGFRS